MGLSQRYWDSNFVTHKPGAKNASTFDDAGLYPDYQAIQDEYQALASGPQDSGSFSDIFGSAAHHFASSATMGLAFTGYKDWEDKNLYEKIGASIGEAAGFFVPMGWIGKGVRGAKSAIGLGSKAVARRSIAAATKSISSQTTKQAFQKGLEGKWSGGILSRYGKRNLYKYELGGRQLADASTNLMRSTEASLRSALKKANVKIDGAMEKTIKTTLQGIDEGLRAGKHINTVSAWGVNAVNAGLKMAGKGPATSKLGKWLTKYTGEFAQDAAVLSIHGVLHNTFMSGALWGGKQFEWAGVKFGGRGHEMMPVDADKDGVPDVGSDGEPTMEQVHKFDPWNAVSHAIVLSTVFPAIRSIKGGGERNLGELWQILRRGVKKTSYDKVAKGSNGAKDIKQLLEMITGGKRATLFKKVEWKGKSGKKWNINDLMMQDFKNPAVLDDAVHILKQMQSSVGKLKMSATFGKAYLTDTLKVGTVSRMALGAVAMNLDMFKENMAGLRGMHPAETLTHMLIGGFMTRGRGGWAHDPASRSGGVKASELDKMYEAAHLMGIDHSRVSDYLSVRNVREEFAKDNAALKYDHAAESINKLYKEYESRILNEGRTYEKSNGEINDPIQEWGLIRAALAIGEKGDAYESVNFNLLTSKEREAFKSELQSIGWKGDKTLKETSYQEFMNEFKTGQTDAITKLHMNWFAQLGKESSKDAGDIVLNSFQDAQGKLIHGGIEWANATSHRVHDLHKMLLVLGKNNLAEHKASGLEKVDLANNPKAIKRLEKMADDFKKTLNRSTLGETGDWYFDLGDAKDNPYLSQMVNSFKEKGKIRMGDMFVGKIKPENSRDKDFIDILYQEIADPDGAIIRPDKYKIRREPGVDEESLDIELKDKFDGITNAMYSSGRATKQAPDIGKNKWIEADIAKRIVEQFDALGMAVPAERLTEHLEYLAGRSIETFPIRPENVTTIQQLVEANLIEKDAEAGKFLFNSNDAIRDMASEHGLDINETLRIHSEIKELLPESTREVSDGALDFTFESGRIPNIEALYKIRETIPELYGNHIKRQINKTLENPKIRMEKEQIETELDLTVSHLRNADYTAALKSVENLENMLPGTGIDFAKLRGTIDTAERNGLPLDLHTFELSQGTGSTYDAIQSIIGIERMASRKIEELMAEMVYKGTNDKFGLVLEHNKLMDNLNVAIGNTVEKTSMTQVFEQYLKFNSYSSLEGIMKGMHQSYSKDKTPNTVSNEHLVDSYEKLMQNYTNPTRHTRISIGEKYGFLDAEKQLKPDVVNILKNGSFQDLLSKYPKLLQKNKEELDSDMAYLSEVVKNSSGRKTIKFGETIINGKKTIVREFVTPDNNIETLTPANKAIDKINSKYGIELIPISKSGVIDGRFQSEISTVDGIKGKFESKAVINKADETFITDAIKTGQKLEFGDIQAAKFGIPELLEGEGFRYIDVSLGRALSFTETATSRQALNRGYNDWYNATVKRYRNDPTMDSKSIDNFVKVFDPAKVVDVDKKIAAMYLTELNTVAFDKLWSAESITEFESKDGHYGLAMKMLSYTKLAEGGSLRPLPSVAAMENMVNTLTDLPGSRRNSIIDIINEEKAGGIKGMFYADEVKTSTNQLLVRNRHLTQVESTIKSSKLKEALRNRYSNKERFDDVMDVSAFDGAVEVSKRLRDLLLTSINEKDNINGFKGSISKSGESDYIHLYGKGLFIYNPRRAAALKQRNVDFLIGESAAKSYKGLNIEGTSIKPRELTQSSLYEDILTSGDSHIMRVGLEGFNIRYGGHVSANATVPHPYTHYMPKDLVIGFREGYQKLTQKFNEISEFSSDLQKSGNFELVQAMMKHQNESGFAESIGIESFGEKLLNIGFSSNNPNVREAVMKVWESQSLPMLIKPRNAKFAFPYMAPNLKAEHPVSLDLYAAKNGIKTGDEQLGGVRIQLGEGGYGVDAKHIPVDSATEFAFSFRKGDVDYITKFDKKSGKWDTYTPLTEYVEKGYATEVAGLIPISAKKGQSISPDVPKSLEKLYKELNDIFTGNHKVHDTSLFRDPSTGVISLSGVHGYVEKLVNGKVIPGLTSDKVNMLAMTERGPRKGRSDFVPTRLRNRSPEEIRDALEEGTIAYQNSLDARSNMQADWDGDRMRMTHDFKSIDKNTAKFDMLKKAYREASINEEYRTMPTEARKVNIFGTGFNKAGELLHAGAVKTNSLSEVKKRMVLDQRAVGKVVSMQGALETMFLNDISISGSKIKDKIGFSIKHIIENGDIYRRFDEVNQTAVDFKSSLPIELIRNTYDLVLYGEGQTRYKGRVFPFEKNSINRDVAAEIIDILKAPHAQFNQVYDAGGGSSATSFSAKAAYIKLRKFYSDPNNYIMNRLLMKYKSSNFMTNEKLNELATLFMQTPDGKKVQVNGIADLKRQMLSGQVRPNKNVIKFGQSMVPDDLVKASNIGNFLSKLNKNQIYKVKDLDNAWSDIQNFSDYKKYSEMMVDEIAALRAVGATRTEMAGNMDNIFSFKKNGISLKNIEQASIMHEILSHESRVIKRELNRASGFKYPNREEIRSLADRYDRVEDATKFIKKIRGEDIIERVQETQKTRFRDHKKPSKIFNQERKVVHVYKVKGGLSTVDGKPNWEGLSFFTSLKPGQSTDKIFGKFVVLDNPIVGHRISRDEALEGYAWHYTFNSMDMFTKESNFKSYMDEAKAVNRELGMGWGDALDGFRKDKANADTYFRNEYNKRRMMLDNFYRRDIEGGINEIKAGHEVADLSTHESMIYYKSKMLLMPRILTRHYTTGDKVPDMAFPKLDKTVFKNVFTWLTESNMSHVAEKLAKEYTGHKDYLMGLTNSATYDLQPSPLFMKNYNLSSAMNRDVLLDIMKGPMDISMKLNMNVMGIGPYRAEYRTPGLDKDYSIRKVRNMMDKWNQNNIDKRKGC